MRVAIGVIIMSGCPWNSFSRTILPHLFAVAFASGAMLLWPLVRRGTGGPSVATAKATRLINREDALVVDVRDAGEYGAGPRRRREETCRLRAWKEGVPNDAQAQGQADHRLLRARHRAGRAALDEERLRRRCSILRAASRLAPGGCRWRSSAWRSVVMYATARARSASRAERAARQGRGDRRRSASTWSRSAAAR